MQVQKYLILTLYRPVDGDRLFCLLYLSPYDVGLKHISLFEVFLLEPSVFHI